MPETPAPTTQSQTPKKDFNLYTASPKEIFFKNFLAGFARALGAIAVYIIFIGVLTILASQFLLPQLQSLLQNFTQSLTPTITTPANLNPNLNSPQIQQLFNQNQTNR